MSGVGGGGAGVGVRWRRVVLAAGKEAGWELPLVGDRAYRDRHLAASVWGSGLLLARLLEEHFSSAGEDGPAPQRVLELGCGCAAAPALVLARLPQRPQVCATDADLEAVQIAAQTLARNGVVDDSRIRTATLNWSQPLPETERGSYDLILGADVIYIGSVARTLLTAVVHHLSPDGVFLLSDPGRDYNMPLVHAAAEELGLRRLQRVVLTKVAVGDFGMPRASVLAYCRADASAEQLPGWVAPLLTSMETNAAAYSGTAAPASGLATAYVLQEAAAPL